MNFKKLNNIIGWVVFAIALYTYTATMERTVSLWDCGEYISTSNKLEVGHPPGAPLFNMTGRLFSAPVSQDNVALSINFMSALSSAFTILFLFWSLTYLAKKMATANGQEFTDGSIIAVLASGAIGALAYTFSDSFWFSAVEGEVYAMSSFYTAAVVWATFKWEERADEPGADRWLILIFFLIGLSIGVHLLNLLAIPAIGYVYYFRKFKVTTPGFLIAGLVSMGILGFVQAILIPGIVGLPALIERISKNSMGLPFNVGLILSFLLIIGLIVLGLMWTHRNKKPLLNTIINCFMVVCIGYSCFFMIPIRSQANTPIDENNPENTASFISYLNREQYGSWPILWGPYWNSDINPDDINDDGKWDAQDYLVNGNPIYMAGYAVKRDGVLIQGFRTEKEAKDYVAQKKLGGVEISAEYFVSDDRKGIDYRYNPDHMTFLPRMFSREERHIHGYMAYSGYDPNNPDQTEFVSRITGKKTRLPTFGNNIRFLLRYQLGWMYFRYFMWNFSGRQNDEQGIGPNSLNGNWISGVPFIDNQHVGNQEKLPDSMSRNLAYNKFFMLPLILGLIGFFFQFIYAKKDWFVILLLFVFTGIMIIIYLNPKPYEPRERDYAYAGSFYAFAFWIGLGVWALYDAARKLKIFQVGVAAAATLLFATLVWLVERGSGDFTFSYSLFYIALVGFGLLALMVLIGNMGNTQARTLAIVACLLGTPVPFIMAKEGWADHDRSNRTTALDFARNFLETCDENAIIFTHGDNDTFPLWYAQEVEGIRTDVRIVNLSLLGTDWYIDQMVRKAYKSDPVPFSAPEYMYRQGGLLDYVQLNAEKGPKGGFLDLKKAMKDVMNDDNVTTSPDGRKYMEIPSRTFSLKVDRSLIEKYGVLDKKELNKVVPEIRFTVPKGNLLKNDLMILDLIANNDWKRPVYFAGGADSKTYLGLDPYFQSEGLAYKFIPIETQADNPNAYGRVNVEKMYHNIMNVYKWGGMDKPGVNVDFFVRHTMTNNYRLMFYTLAQELSTRGKRADFFIKQYEAQIKAGQISADSVSALQGKIKTQEAEKAKNFKMAKEVIDKCLQVMPESNVPYDRIMPSFVAIMYDINDQEGARKVARKLVEDHYKNFVYYTSLQPRFAPGIVMDDAELSYRIVGMMEKMTADNKDDQIHQEFERKLLEMNAMLVNWAAHAKVEDDINAENLNDSQYLVAFYQTSIFKSILFDQDGGQAVMQKVHEIKSKM